jgi:hypothetical protein
MSFPMAVMFCFFEDGMVFRSKNFKGKRGFPITLINIEMNNICQFYV